MSRKKKKPKAKRQPKTGKNPRLDSRISPDTIGKQRPKWKFKFIDLNGPWGWLNFTGEGVSFQDLKIEMIEFEEKSWNEILRKRNHAIPVFDLEKEAQSRLEEIGMDFVENLISLRIKKVPRVWGYKDGVDFYILWWDPRHEVYQVNRPYHSK